MGSDRYMESQADCQSNLALARERIRALEERISRPLVLSEIEVPCHECGEQVGLVDIGDVNGAAAMTWKDFVVREIAPPYQSQVVAFHVDCEWA